MPRDDEKAESFKQFTLWLAAIDRDMDEVPERWVPAILRDEQIPQQENGSGRHSFPLEEGSESLSGTEADGESRSDQRA